MNFCVHTNECSRTENWYRTQFDLLLTYLLTYLLCLVFYCLSLKFGTVFYMRYPVLNWSGDRNAKVNENRWVYSAAFAKSLWRLLLLSTVHRTVHLSVTSRQGSGQLDTWRRLPGGPRKHSVEQITTSTGLSPSDAWSVAADRPAWRALRPLDGQAQRKREIECRRCFTRHFETRLRREWTVL